MHRNRLGVVFFWVRTWLLRREYRLPLFLWSSDRFVRLLHKQNRILGMGCALMRNSIISVMCEYFNETRNFVKAFISIGPGIGIFVLPRIIMPLISAVGCFYCILSRL